MSPSGFGALAPEPARRDNELHLQLHAYGYGFFVQHPLVERIVQMTSSPPPPGASGPPPELMALIRRVQLGGIGMGLLIVTIVFLMVVKPKF